MCREAVFFKSVKAHPNRLLEVNMGAEMHIVFDFNAKIGTVRFGCLKDDSVFSSVRTDGSYLIFGQEQYHSLKIGAKEFMDLVFETASEKAALIEDVMQYK